MNHSADDKSLDRFLDVVYRNQHVNKIRFADRYRIILRVDFCFIEIAKHLVNPVAVHLGGFGGKFLSGAKSGRGLRAVALHPQGLLLFQAPEESANSFAKDFDGVGGGAG